VTGQGQPANLLRDPISELPHWYTKMFWDLVRSSGSDRALVQSATLTLNYDLQRTRPSLAAANGLQSPYICDVSILDFVVELLCALRRVVACGEISITLICPPMVESNELVSTLMAQYSRDPIKYRPIVSDSSPQTVSGYM